MFSQDLMYKASWLYRLSQNFEEAEITNATLSPYKRSSDFLNFPSEIFQTFTIWFAVSK